MRFQVFILAVLVPRLYLLFAEERTSSETKPSGTASAATASAPVNAPITFASDIAPIIFQNCVSCHRAGEAAPFPLTSYAEVKKRAKLIAEVTERRFMPPWHAAPGFGEFHDERTLTRHQIQLIQQWVNSGARDGDPARLPALPKFAEGWQAGVPDLVVKMPDGYAIRSDGPDVYRNFVLQLDLSEDKFVKAIEFRPSARNVVHHSLFFLDTSGTARQLDAMDAEPGFRGMGRGQRQFTPIGGWAVGANPRMLPEELAWKIPKGADLVLQTHFHPSGKAELEQSTVGIYFAKTPPKRSFVGIQLPPLFGALAGVDIPAGQTNYTIRDQFVLPIDVEAFAVGGHAHYLGKQMKMRAVLPDGKERGLLRIPDWDFNWQEQYSFKQFVPLPKGTRIEVEVSYDNSEQNPRNPTHPPKRVKWGRMSNDEMGCMTLQVVAAREEEVGQLQSAVKQHIQEAVLKRVMTGAAALPNNGPRASRDGISDDR